MYGDQEVGEKRGKGGEGGGDLVTLFVRHLYSAGQHLKTYLFLSQLLLFRLGLFPSEVIQPCH